MFIINKRVCLIKKKCLNKVYFYFTWSAQCLILLFFYSWFFCIWPQNALNKYCLFIIMLFKTTDDLCQKYKNVIFIFSHLIKMVSNFLSRRTVLGALGYSYFRVFKGCSNDYLRLLGLSTDNLSTRSDSSRGCWFSRDSWNHLSRRIKGFYV